MKIPFISKKEETEQVEAEIVEPGEMTTQAQDNLKEQLLSEISNRIGISLERRDSHEYHEEAISPVITIGTDLDKEDEISKEIKTKSDKWGLWNEYHGTKGRIFDTEVPQFQFGHVAAITPNLRSHVYRITYAYDDEGKVKKDTDNKPIILKKIRINLVTELMNLKARLNLAENGYARDQQKSVIIGGVGGVTPITESSFDKLTTAAFGRQK
jgi:hypothetical protein